MATRSIPSITILSPGAMGSGIAAVIADHGAQVLTSLAGRGAESIQRANQARMIDAPDPDLVRSEIIVSIVPPADAEGIVDRLLPHLTTAESKPLFVDANALSPELKRKLASRVTAAGCAFLDGGIIGAPPSPGKPPPKLYVSGPSSDRVSLLADFGVDLRIMNGEVGAASALKMCYAGLNKGVTGLGSAMLLASERSGAAEALAAEMADSMPDLASRFRRQIPPMYPKAYRWVAEMREIAAFLEDDPATAMIFEGMALLYERLAKSVATEGQERDALDKTLKRGPN